MGVSLAGCGLLWEFFAAAGRGALCSRQSLKVGEESTMRMRRSGLVGLLGHWNLSAGLVVAMMVGAVGTGRAQQEPAAAPAPPPDPMSQTPQTPSSTPAVPIDAPAPASAPPAGGTPAPAPPPEPLSQSPQTPSSTPQVPKQEVDTSVQATPAAPVQPGPAAKKGKEVYTGPTTVVMLEPTPMLDEEGRQRLDPSGKPMFNPPVAQQRDKHGHPLFDEKGKPVFQTAKDMGYDENGKKIHSEKEKKTHTVAVSISHGTLTIDGLTGKAGLNYEISDLKYIYLYVPWIGLTVVSNDPFPGALEEKDAFKENTLTVKAGDHVLELYSEKKLLGKKPESAYVSVDRNFKLQTRFPIMGYGSLRQAPYDFPGSKVDVASKGAKAAPPLPESLRPGTVLPPCPAGQMRPAGAVVLDGQPIPACQAIRAAPARAVAGPASSAPPA